MHGRGSSIGACGEVTIQGDGRMQVKEVSIWNGTRTIGVLAWSGSRTLEVSTRSGGVTRQGCQRLRAWNPKSYVKAN